MFFLKKLTKKKVFTVAVFCSLVCLFFLPKIGLADDNTRSLLCLGDSVTHGYPYVGTSITYPAKLQASLAAEYGANKYNIINRGVSGYRADQVLSSLQSQGWLADDNPDAVLLMAGGNDLAQEINPDLSNLFTVLDQTVSEMQSIVDLIKSHKNTDGSTPQVLVSTFIPNNISGVGGSAVVAMYNSRLQDNLTGADLIFTDNWEDFYDTNTGQANTDLMADESHPNETGYIVMAANWHAAVNEKIEPPTGAGGDTGGITNSDGFNINPKVVVTSGPGEKAKLQVYSRYGYPSTTEIRDLFPENYIGGAGIVSLDSNNNGLKDQILIFAASQGGPQARVFGIRETGELVFKGQQFVFDSNIRDGLSMTSGDFDNDGYVDDVAACLTGEQLPVVKVYKDAIGVDSWQKIGEFRAPFGKVGCNVGTFQYDTGASEILVSPHHGPADPEVYTYTVGGTQKSKFTAYGSGVTSGLTPSGITDRIYTTPNNGSSHVMAFDKNGKRQNFWWAYDKHVRGDFKNVAGDIDLDGKDEILISPIGANGPQVLAFEATGYWRTWPNFFAFGDKTLRNGVGVAVIDNWHGKN